MNTKQALVAVGLVALLAGTVAVAQHGSGGRGPGGGMPGHPAGMRGGPGAGGPGMGRGEAMVPRVTEALQLTEAQIAAWATIREETQVTVEPLATQARALHEEIRTALEAGTADATAIGTKLIAAHTLEVKVRAAMDAGRAAFRALLTDEQKAKFDLLQQMRNGKGHGRRGCPPPTD